MREKNPNETLFKAFKILFGRTMSFQEVNEQYEFEDFEFPFTDKTLKLRERFRIILIIAIIILLFGFGIGFLNMINLPEFLVKFIPQDVFLNSVNVASLWIKRFSYLFFVWASWTYFKVLVYQLVRQRLYERNVWKNDKLAMQLKADILRNLALDRKVARILNKEEDKRTEEEKAKLTAVDLIKDMRVHVNTRENLEHFVETRFEINIYEGDYDMEESEVGKLVKQSEKGGDGTPKISQVASKVMAQKVKFGSIMQLPDGTFSVRARKDRHFDPYFFDDEFKLLEKKVADANTYHSFPYCKGTIDEDGIRDGLTDNTARNRENKRKAQEWTDKQVQLIEDLFNQNGIEANYNRNETRIMPNTAELLYVTPPTYKVSKNDYDLLERIAERVNEECKVAGTTIKMNIDGLHVSLTIPNGMDHKGKQTDLNFTQIQNLEDVLRKFCG